MPWVALVAPTTVPGVQVAERRGPVESYQDGSVMRLPRGWGSVGAPLFGSSVVADDQHWKFRMRFGDASQVGELFAALAAQLSALAWGVQRDHDTAVVAPPWQR